MHSNKKRTTEEFVQEARLVHGNKYDYSKVFYVNRTTKVCITCPNHGDFLQRPADHLNGHGCEQCSGKTKSCREEFITKAKKVHGDKYDYSDVIYVNNKTKVLITCNRCNKKFCMTPNQHLSGRGCRTCGIKHRSEKRRGVGRFDNRKGFLEVGINDYNGSTTKLLSYKIWGNMLTRCYDKDYHQKKSTYSDCSVCDEWLYFSNFKKWFDENHVEGYHLDKDILVKGNKVYSPDTCCFVPAGLNSLLTKRDSCRGNYPIGVKKTPSGRYLSSIHKHKNKIVIGIYDTPEAAFYAYKEAKEAYIKEVAQEYYDAGKITKRVYDALMNYKVEITD